MKANVLMITFPLLLLLWWNIPIRKIEKFKNYILISLFSVIPPFFNTRGIYVEGIDNYVYNLFYTQLLEGIEVGHGDFGFDYISFMLAQLQVPSFLFFYIISLSQVYSVFWFLKKYSKSWKFSFTIYIISLYFVVNFNAIRQGVSLVFLLLGTDRLLNRKHFLSLIYYLVSISMHFSSIVAIVLLISSNYIANKSKKFEYKRLMLIYIVTQIFGKPLNILIKKIVMLVTPLQYSNYLSNEFYMGYRFTLPYFMYLFFITFMIGLIVNLDAILEKRNLITRENKYFLTVMYFGLIFMLISSNFVILRRINIYILLFYPILLTNYFQFSKNKNLIYFLNFIVLLISALY